jgi:hypothetical protein
MRRARGNFVQPCYPIVERYGLIFAYMYTPRGLAIESMRTLDDKRTLRRITELTLTTGRMVASPTLSVIGLINMAGFAERPRDRVRNPAVVGTDPRRAPRNAGRLRSAVRARHDHVA